MILQELMTKNRYKAKDIAEVCGVTTSAVTHWLNGSCMPSIENLRKIAQFFGITVDDLLKEPLEEA